MFGGCLNLFLRRLFLIVSCRSLIIAKQDKITSVPYSELYNDYVEWSMSLCAQGEREHDWLDLFYFFQSKTDTFKDGWMFPHLYTFTKETHSCLISIAVPHNNNTIYKIKEDKPFTEIVILTFHWQKRGLKRPDHSHWPINPDINIGRVQQEPETLSQQPWTGKWPHFPILVYGLNS